MADADRQQKVFDISFGTSSADSCVKVNGEDISGAIRGCTVECLAGEVTKVTLLVLGVNARVTVQAALDQDHVDVIDTGHA